LAIIASSVNVSPTITIAEEPLTYDMPGQPVLVDKQATLDDPDAPHFGDGRLTVRLEVAGGEPARDERIGIGGDAAGTGEIRVADGRVLFDGGDSNGPVQIGTLGSENGHTHALTVSLTDRASRKAVQSLLRHITYTAENPLTAQRQVLFQLDDGQGCLSHPAVRTLLTTPALGTQPPFNAQP
jgi:hypothetical protein